MSTLADAPSVVTVTSGVCQCSVGSVPSNVSDPEPVFPHLMHLPGSGSLILVLEGSL
jgi:hypothetical protein